MLTLLNVLQLSQTVPHSGCTSRHRQHTLHVLTAAVLASVKWNLAAVWTGTSLIINDTEQLFRCLWATCISPLETCLFKSSAYFTYRICLSTVEV